jgi:mxaK protein
VTASQNISVSTDALTAEDRDNRAIWSKISGGWGAARPRLLLGLPFVLAGAALILLILALRQDAVNRTIQGLKSNHDIAVATDAPPESLLARIQFLLTHDRVDEIQPYVESLDKIGSDKFRAIAHYDYANGRLRQAFDMITQGKLDSAGPYVVLARQEYRRALTFAPQDWDAKFNLDVASRLIRDFPAFERTSGDTVKVDRRKVWTDIPGTPKGLP